MPTQATAPWWNGDYLYRQSLEIVAPALEAIPAGYTCTIDTDTAALQTAGKVLANRNDWRVVYWNGTTNTELDRVYVSATETHFKIQAAIAAAATDYSYYIYYGYASAGTPPQDYNDVYHWGDDFEDGSISDWTQTIPTWTASPSSPLAGSYSLYTSWAASSYPVAYTVFTSTTVNNLIFRLTIRTSATGGVFVNLQDTDTMALQVRSTTENHFEINNVECSPTYHLLPNTTYAIKVLLDLSAHTCDAYVDGDLKEAGMSVGSSTSVNRVRCTLRASGNTRYDNMSVAVSMATDPTVNDGTEYSYIGSSLGTAWNILPESDYAISLGPTTWTLELQGNEEG